MVIGRIGARYDQKPLDRVYGGRHGELPPSTRHCQNLARDGAPNPTGYPNFFHDFVHFLGARRNTGTRVHEKEK